MIAFFELLFDSNFLRIGNVVKTAPKGYTKNHPAIDWLRFKQHIF
jgi:hypothetical protein